MPSLKFEPEAICPDGPSPAAGRAARSKAQGQPDLSEGCVRRDDAYKVFILIWFLLGPK